MSGHPIRCPACKRLVARLVAGHVEVKIRKFLIARFESGELGCARCGCAVKLPASR